MALNVFDQMLNNMSCLLFLSSFNVKRQAELIISGEKQMKKQQTAKEHVEILLYFLFCFFLSS